MINKRTRTFGNDRSYARKASVLALAATMALTTGSLACAPAALASNESGIAGGSAYATHTAIVKTFDISSAIQHVVARAADYASTQDDAIQMEEVASQVIEQAAQDKAQAKAAAKAKKTAKVTKALKTAKSLKGTPYVYGGSTPSGFDCSGFTMYCYGKAGVSLTHNAQAQFNQTKSVSTNNMKKGDLVFFGSSTSSITHVGIYVGNGKYIHSPQSGETVSIDSLSSRSNFVGATRPVK